MELALITFNKLIQMFVILIFGIAAYKTKLISKDGNKTLSNVLLMIVNPVVLFMAFQQDYTPQLIEGFLVSVAFAIISHLIGILLSTILIKKSIKDYDVERIACTYSNCGFIGIPIINALYGVEGVFYLAAYMTVFNIFLWTHGLVLSIGKFDKKTILSGLISPCMIAIVLGVAFAPFKIPEFLDFPFDAICDMNTPLAMIIAGATMAQSNIFEALKNKRLYIITFLKLLVIPMVAALILVAFSYNEMVTTTAIIEVACPTGASGTMFALRYGKNAIYASEIYVVTTLLAAISLPIVIMFARFIG